MTNQPTNQQQNKKQKENEIKTFSKYNKLNYDCKYEIFKFILGGNVNYNNFIKRTKDMSSYYWRKKRDELFKKEDKTEYNNFLNKYIK